MEIIVTEISHAVVITLNRPEQGNSINKLLLTQINQALDQYENNLNFNAIILEATGNIFCAGMDFKNAFSENDIALYMNTLKRFTEIQKIMIAKLNGKVIAGGLGLVSACDLVFASNQTTFSLPEVLWGLLPANVLPFLIRRVGFQSAYAMTLSHEVISAKHAQDIHLVDYIDADINQALLRLSRVDLDTIKNMKSYFQKLWIINKQTEELAVNTLADLIQKPLVQKNIKNFLEHKKLPWEK